MGRGRRSGSFLPSALRISFWYFAGAVQNLIDEREHRTSTVNGSVDLHLSVALPDHLGATHAWKLFFRGTGTCCRANVMQSNKKR
jgi:hypothetical protein